MKLSKRAQALNAMPLAERAHYLATGRMVVRHIFQVVDGDFKERWMAKSRGVALRGDDGRFLFDTREEALVTGRQAMARIRRDAATP